MVQGQTFVAQEVGKGEDHRKLKAHLGGRARTAVSNVRLRGEGAHGRETGANKRKKNSSQHEGFTKVERGAWTVEKKKSVRRAYVRISAG